MSPESCRNRKYIPIRHPKFFLRSFVRLSGSLELENPPKSAEILANRADLRARFAWISVDFEGFSSSRAPLSRTNDLKFFLGRRIGIYFRFLQLSGDIHFFIHLGHEICRLVGFFLRSPSYGSFCDFLKLTSRKYRSLKVRCEFGTKDIIHDPLLRFGLHIDTLLQAPHDTAITEVL